MVWPGLHPPAPASFRQRVTSPQEARRQSHRQAAFAQIEFATDSPLEGTGFELSVPRDIGFVSRLCRSSDQFAAARLPRFSGPRPSWADRSSRRVSRAVAGPPTDWGCKAAIQGAAAHHRIRRRDQGRAVGDESASRNRKFESTSLQQRDAMGQATTKWHHRRCL